MGRGDRAADWGAYQTLAGMALTAVLGLWLTYWFFPILWLGGGLVGGDLYPYFMPQKVTYADALLNGELPLWNSLVGHGYPQLAESQTGVFYPPHLVAYRLLDVNSAYVLVQLGHYAIAFWGVVALARSAGLTWIASWLAALCYVYGWFPPRICLEWTIIGGAWLPWAVYGVERWLQTNEWKFCFIVWAALVLQLLAGHFVFAFMTLLLAVSWLGIRLWGNGPRAGDRSVLAIGIAVSVVGAFLAAAVQLVPTWEYKQLSQRRGHDATFDPGYGGIPWRYLSQLWLPWSAYTDPGDINNIRGGAGSLTNRVEAHLYFGLLPLALLVVGCGTRGVGFISRPRNRDAEPSPPPEASREPDILSTMWWPLVAVGVLATIHATGELNVVTSRLPGFGYFTGPGRFGLITTFVAALLVGRTWDDLWNRRKRPGRAPRVAFLRPVIAAAAGVVVFGLTLADFGWVAGHVGYAVEVMRPPVQFRDRSQLKAYLTGLPSPVRLFCRGANIPTLLGVASVPTYLGLAPAAYSDPALAMPQPYPFDEPPTAEQIDWLRRAGVTHLLTFRPIDESAWPVRSLGVFDDPMLSLAWGRYAESEPPVFWLYELNGSRGRIAWEQGDQTGTARIVRYGIDRVEAEVDSKAGGRLILTDLAYPGWNVRVDGAAAESATVGGMYRGVDLPAGPHRVVWEYQPLSFRIGAVVTLATLAVAAAVGHVRFWHPGWIAAAAGWLRNRRRAGDPAR